MRVNLLKNGGEVYSSHAYLVRGEWNRLEDVNTLVDTGSSSSIVTMVEAMATGFGKHPLEQVILTHSHTDHVGGLMELVREHQPRVFAYARF